MSTPSNLLIKLLRTHLTQVGNCFGWNSWDINTKFSLPSGEKCAAAGCVFPLWADVGLPKLFSVLVWHESLQYNVPAFLFHIPWKSDEKWHGGLQFIPMSCRDIWQRVILSHGTEAYLFLGSRFFCPSAWRSILTSRTAASFFSQGEKFG